MNRLSREYKQEYLEHAKKALDALLHLGGMPAREPLHSTFYFPAVEAGLWQVRGMLADLVEALQMDLARKALPWTERSSDECYVSHSEKVGWWNVLISNRGHKYHAFHESDLLGVFDTKDDAVRACEERFAEVSR